MNNIELFRLTGKEKDVPLAVKWSYNALRPRELFHIKRADWRLPKNKQADLTRFEVVRMSYGMSYMDNKKEVFGVVTTITETYKFSWRRDWRVSVKVFDNILDAIEYSEKKRAKYERELSTRI